MTGSEEQDSAGLFSLLLSRVESTAPSEIMTAHEGDIVGDFELIELLGRGGMGEVWAAEQRSLNRRVALKLVLPERVSEQSLALFAREARAGGRLSHPGIVTVYDHGESDGLAWIAMELVEGAHTLRDLLDELLAADQVPDGYHTQAAEFIATVADALQTAHEAGVIHRDIKPQNLLIGSDEKPKITDFGLARITDEELLSVTGDFAGTYAYMSPEQAMAKRMGLDHRTDIFSLGVTLYEMLSLRRPFEGDTAAQIAEQIVTKEAPDPRAIRSRVPRDLAVICGKCLEKDRDRRYATMAELAADLDRYLADEPILAKPPSAWQRTVMWTKRHPTRTVAAAISVIAFGVIASLLAANVAANADLETANGDLQTASETISEKNAALESNITEIQRKVTEIGRLSDMQDVEDLLNEADELWPVDPADIPRYEGWIRTAESLLDELPQHYATREVVRQTALQQSPEELQEQREMHPDYPRLVQLRALRAALLQRRDGTELQVPSVNKDSLPKTLQELLAFAEGLVAPARVTFGREGLGMVAAQLAVVLAERERDNEGYARAQSIVSEAAFSMGRDEEAIEAIQIAVDLAPDSIRSYYELRLSQLEKRVAEISSPEGMANAEAELAEIPDLEARVNERTDWRFPAEHSEARWWNSQLTKLIEELEELRSKETGLLGAGLSAEQGWGIGRRLELARKLEAGFAAGGQYARRWETALPEIHAAYPGLPLEMQSGLVPVGPDPASELWEFWHVASGTEPTRDPEGKLRMTGESGLVFVLLPGGPFAMGAQTTNQDLPNYDIGAGPASAPIHRVKLSPFFLSKYEMTQGQWKNFTGHNPSTYGEGTHPISNADGQGPWPLHPVESVSWFECTEVCRRLGLVLPTEAEWEYGCRAGTTTRWWTGAEKESLQGAANLADKSAFMAPWGSSSADWLDDGYVDHAPVNEFRANAFGLHSTHGNVLELCRDIANDNFYQYSPEWNPVAARRPSWDSQFTMSTEDGRPDRGGAFDSGESFSSSATRDFSGADVPFYTAGLRPARAITE